MFGQAPPEITYLGRGTGPFNIGPARPDRMIVTFFVSESDAGNQLSSATLGGVTANILPAGVSADPAGIAYAVVPTGTTASVSGNLAAQASYMVTGLNINNVFSSSVIFSNAQSVSTPDGFSAIICAARGRNGYAPFTASATGVASNLTANDTANMGGGGGAGNPSWVVGSVVVTDGAGSVTVNQSGTFVSPIGCSIVLY